MLVYLYLFVWYTHIFVVVNTYRYLKLPCIFECVKVMINIFITHVYCTCIVSMIIIIVFKFINFKTEKGGLNINY